MSEITTLFLQDAVLRVVAESKDGGRYWPTVVVVPSNGSDPYLENGNYSPDFMALRETLSPNSFRAICQELTALRSRVEELQRCYACGSPTCDERSVCIECNRATEAAARDLQRRLDAARADAIGECVGVLEKRTLICDSEVGSHWAARRHETRVCIKAIQESLGAGEAKR